MRNFERASLFVLVLVTAVAAYCTVRRGEELPPYVPVKVRVQSSPNDPHHPVLAFRRSSPDDKQAGGVTYRVLRGQAAMNFWHSVLRAESRVTPTRDDCVSYVEYTVTADGTPMHRGCVALAYDWRGEHGEPVVVWAEAPIVDGKTSADAANSAVRQVRIEAGR